MPRILSRMDVTSSLGAALAGRYEIDREIGRGGMATVYLARDVRHERQVAIKVLDPELGAVLGVERFLAEIRVTANLQHPNLLPLFDSGAANGNLFYVMPFVAGETLRHRLDREKQLPVDEAVQIAICVANALGYAHERGVIHRDLKPENILLQHGQPVVADFGIALAISNAGGARVTQTGLSLGTPQYMSPEQAAGDRAIDGRSDIYSLGAILYEMLAGEPPHVGNTVQAVIAKVLTEKPRPLTATRDTVPAYVARAVDKALAKLPADRFATAGQFAERLHHGGSEDVDGRATGGYADTGVRWLRHPASIAAVVVAALCALAAVFLAARRPTMLTRWPVRFTVELPSGSSSHSAFGLLGSISPDGRRIAFVAESRTGRQIWVRELDQDTPRPIAGTGGAVAPTFSPDGRWIVFYSGPRLALMRARVDGGEVTTVVSTSDYRRIGWITNDTIVYSPAVASDSRLMRVPLAGGLSRRLFAHDSSSKSMGQSEPYVSPDGRTVFFTARRPAGNPSTDQIAFTPITSGEVDTTGLTGRLVLGYANGQLFYGQNDGAIMAVPFDMPRRRITGTPAPTGEVAQVDQYGPKVSLSASGDLVYVDGLAAATPVLIAKNASPVPLIAGERTFAFPRYSPDGSRIAMAITEAGRTDVWIYVIASRTLERLTTTGTENTRPEWAPDGKRVLFRSTHTNKIEMWWQMADNSAPAERLTPVAPVSVQEAVISPDGGTLMYRIDTQDQSRDIYIMPLTGSDRTPRPFLATPFDELTPRFSPDGNWVAYVSNESGIDEVYVRAFPGPSGRVLVSNGGGAEPVWSKDGRSVFYKNLTAVIKTTLSISGQVPAVTVRDTVASGVFLGNRYHPMYDAAPDGKSLLMLSAPKSADQLIVVLNWTQGVAMKRRQIPHSEDR
jgi:Tol biopolymer transport system component